MRALFSSSISEVKYSPLPPQIIFPKNKDVIEAELGEYKSYFVFKLALCNGLANMGIFKM